MMWFKVLKISVKYAGNWSLEQQREGNVASGRNSEQERALACFCAMFLGKPRELNLRWNSVQFIIIIVSRYASIHRKFSPKKE